MLSVGEEFPLKTVAFEQPTNIMNRGRLMSLDALSLRLPEVNAESWPAIL
jgi:hypothetical protein